jgi:hypothetical protein
MFVHKSGGLAVGGRKGYSGLPLSSTASHPTFMSRRDLPSTPRAHLTMVSAILSLGLLSYLLNLRSILAILCNLACLTMFLSPLSKLAQILRAGYAPPGSIPIPFTLCQALNCFFWSVHGICQLRDIAVWAPNVFGLGAAMVQVGVIFFYGGKRRERCLGGGDDL